MKKLIVLGASLISLSAFAQHANFDIPGLGTAKGSMGSQVEGTTINVTGNKSGKVIVTGGTLSAGPASLKMGSTATVNSVQISGSKVKDSTINVSNNTSDDVIVTGGTATVNSVQIN